MHNREEINEFLSNYLQNYRTEDRVDKETTKNYCAVMDGLSFDSQNAICNFVLDYERALIELLSECPFLKIVIE